MKSCGCVPILGTVACYNSHLLFYTEKNVDRKYADTYLRNCIINSREEYESRIPYVMFAWLYFFYVRVFGILPWLKWFDLHNHFLFKYPRAAMQLLTTIVTLPIW